MWARFANAAARTRMGSLDEFNCRLLRPGHSWGNDVVDSEFVQCWCRDDTDLEHYDYSRDQPNPTGTNDHACDQRDCCTNWMDARKWRRHDCLQHHRPCQQLHLFARLDSAGKCLFRSAVERGNDDVELRLRDSRYGLLRDDVVFRRFFVVQSSVGTVVLAELAVLSKRRAEVLGRDCLDAVLTELLPQGLSRGFLYAVTDGLELE